MNQATSFALASVQYPEGIPATAIYHDTTKTGLSQGRYHSPEPPEYDDINLYSSEVATLGYFIMVTQN